MERSDVGIVAAARPTKLFGINFQNKTHKRQLGKARRGTMAIELLHRFVQ